MGDLHQDGRGEALQQRDRRTPRSHCFFTLRARRCQLGISWPLGLGLCLDRASGLEIASFGLNGRQELCPTGQDSNGDAAVRSEGRAAKQTRTPNKTGRPNEDGVPALVQIQQPHQLCRPSIGPPSGVRNEAQARQPVTNHWQPVT